MTQPPGPWYERLIQAQAHAEEQPYDIRLVLWRDGIEVDVMDSESLIANTNGVARPH